MIHTMYQMKMNNLFAKNVAPIYIHDRTNPTIAKESTPADTKMFKLAKTTSNKRRVGLQHNQMIQPLN
jgi:hypothetical protein